MTDPAFVLIFIQCVFAGGLMLALRRTNDNIDNQLMSYALIVPITMVFAGVLSFSLGDVALRDVLVSYAITGMCYAIIRYYRYRVDTGSEPTFGMMIMFMWNTLFWPRIFFKLMTQK